MELAPSEVREVVLADHAAIRTRLELVRRAIRAVEEERDPAPLRELLPALLDQLEAHLELEDQLLAPVLRTIDAWGPERVQRLSEEHAAQRAWIRESRDRLAEGAGDARALATQAEAMIERLEADMAHEERSVLDPEVLTDGVIQVDFGG